MLIKKMKVQEIAGQIRGVSYKPEDIKNSLDNNSVILLRANNIDNGRINFDEVIYVDKRKVSENQYLQRDDILICTSSGSRHLVGKAASVDFDKPCTFGAFCRVIRPQSNIGEYLGLYFQSNIYKRNILKSAIGANINNIRTEHISSLELPVYDYKDRMKIIRRIRLIQSIIFYRQTELVALDKLIKARFVEMFGDESNPCGWPVVKVKDVANVSVGVVMKPAQYYTDAEHGIRAFRSLNIGSMKIKDTDWVYFSEEGNTKNAKSILKENDLIIVRSGAPGTACVVTKEYEGCNAIDIIIAHPDTSKLNPYYLCAYTNLPHGKCQIDQGTGGAAQQHFNVGKYNKLSLFLPPIEKQNEYVEFLDQVNKSKFVPRSN